MTTGKKSGMLTDPWNGNGKELRILCTAVIASGIVAKPTSDITDANLIAKTASEIADAIIEREKQ
ncbi:hypothetical protein LLG39_09630 [bacterium]|nr:hypothetical protein [bacterium]